MKIYRLPFLFWRQAIIREIEFPKNLFFLVLVTIFRFTTQLIIVQVVFTHTSTLAGWSKDAALIFLATWGIVNGILHLFFEQSFVQFGDDIHHGGFDFHILRPVDTQILVSFRRLGLHYFGEITFFIALLVFVLVQGGIVVTLLGIAGYLFLLLLGLIVGYHFWFFLTTLVIWSPMVEHFNFFAATTLSIGRYPLELYGATARRIFLTIVPIGLIAAMPSEFLLGVGTKLGVIFAVGITVTVVTLTRLWWNFALRHYASASS